MKSMMYAAIAAVSIAPAAFAAPAAVDGNDYQAYEAVDSFSALGGLHSFEPLDRERLVVWVTPSKPYLIELAYPSSDLRFANAIAIDSRTSQIYSRFDSVRIRGIKYPIDGIYRLNREQADAL
jgi:hypothetical protein